MPSHDIKTQDQLHDDMIAKRNKESLEHLKRINPSLRIIPKFDNQQK